MGFVPFKNAAPSSLDWCLRWNDEGLATEDEPPKPNQRNRPDKYQFGIGLGKSSQVSLRFSKSS
jgi:hypothetical protein